MMADTPTHGGGVERVTKMTTIENEDSSGKTVVIDDKNFVNCHFTNCKLVYGGGDYALTETRLDNCQIMLVGAAQRTAGLLGNFGMFKGGGPFNLMPNAPQNPPKMQ
jgi:hypothetical protein